MSIEKAINKSKTKKPPSRDIITGFWYKQLNFFDQI